MTVLHCGVHQKTRERQGQCQDRHDPGRRILAERDRQKLRLETQKIDQNERKGDRRKAPKHSGNDTDCILSAVILRKPCQHRKGK